MCPRVKEDSGCCPIGIIYICIYAYLSAIYIYINIVTIYIYSNYIYILLHICQPKACLSPYPFLSPTGGCGSDAGCENGINTHGSFSLGR